MKPSLLPSPPSSCFVGAHVKETAVLIQNWRENLLQATRQWLRGGGDITLWLRDFNRLRIHIIDAVWRFTVPEQYQRDVRYILFGSAARGEDVLSSDLDHGLLLAGTSHQLESLRPHLYEFIQTMSSFGFPPCQGFVMSTNPRWVGTSLQWKDRISQYLQLPTWEYVRYLFMMVDSVPLPRQLYQESDAQVSAGSAEADWNEIRSQALAAISESPYLCWEMSHLGIHETVATQGQFWRVVRSRPKHINVKSGLLAPVIHSLRLLSIVNGIHDLPTLLRLEQLTVGQVLDRGFAKEIRECLEYGWTVRILHFIERGNPGQENDIALYKLPHSEQESLFKHLQTAKKLEQMVHRRFRKPR